LISRLDLEVRYALDNLLISSSDFSLRLSECPPLLNSLLDYFFECLEKYIAISGTNWIFLDYKSLFELEQLTKSSFQANSDSTFDDLKALGEKLIIIATIFRNASLNPENVEIMGKHPGFSNAVYMMFKFPIPQDIYDYWTSGDVDLILSCTPLYALEFRKCGLILLSNLGLYFTIEDESTMQLIVDVCSDFIMEKDTSYVYPAIDALAHLWVMPKNQATISELKNIPHLCERLMRLLPTRYFTYDISQSQLAMYELVMLVLCTLVTTLRGQAQTEVCALPGLIPLMLTLSKRPPIPGIQLEIIQQFWSVRERAFKSYLTACKATNTGKQIEQYLTMLMIFAQRDGDNWMINMILEFLADCE
jgi:hypothetical protein